MLGGGLRAKPLVKISKEILKSDKFAKMYADPFMRNFAGQTYVGASSRSSETLRGQKDKKKHETMAGQRGSVNIYIYIPREREISH